MNMDILTVAIAVGAISGAFGFLFGYFHGCKVTNKAWVPFSEGVGMRITALEDAVRRGR